MCVCVQLKVVLLLLSSAEEVSCTFPWIHLSLVAYLKVIVTKTFLWLAEWGMHFPHYSEVLRCFVIREFCLAKQSQVIVVHPKQRSRRQLPLSDPRLYSGMEILQCLLTDERPTLNQMGWGGSEWGRQGAHPNKYKARHTFSSWSRSSKRPLAPYFIIMPRRPWKKGKMYFLIFFFGYNVCVAAFKWFCLPSLFHQSVSFHFDFMCKWSDSHIAASHRELGDISSYCVVYCNWRKCGFLTQ